MALARIFSCSPEQATALIQDLERQGYKVEVLRPEETPTGRADLEIQYELCDTHVAVARAQELAAEYHADIAVESGALQPALGETAKLVELPHQEVSEPALEGGNEALSEQEVPASSQFEAQSWTAQSNLDAEIPPQELTPELDETKQGIQVEARQPNPLSAVWARGATALIAATGNVALTSRTLWLAGLQKMREQRERASIRAAEAHAEREQRLLELTCQRAEAVQRSQQLEAARRAAAVYLTQLQREESGNGATEPAAQEKAPVVPLASAPKDLNTWWSPSQHVKNIAAGAAAAGVLFALTLGISTLRNKPSASKASQPTVTVAPTPAQTPVAPEQAITVTSRPSPVIRKTNQTTRAHSVSVHPNSRARRAAPADDEVADDVVVRHFSKPQQRLQSRVSNGVKHYSDTN